MENIKNLLPIGSVVILKGGRKKIMIIGVKQTDLKTQKEYDYLAVPYPEGFLTADCTFFIDESAIEKVFFRGYEDEERNLFIDKLNEYYEEFDNSENQE